MLKVSYYLQFILLNFIIITFHQVQPLKPINHLNLQEPTQNILRQFEAQLIGKAQCLIGNRSEMLIYSIKGIFINSGIKQLYDLSFGLFRMNFGGKKQEGKGVRIGLKDRKGGVEGIILLEKFNLIGWIVKISFKKGQRRIELNRFQIQMEEGVDMIEQICENSQSQSLNLSSSHHLQPTDDFALMISQLILLKKPIFIVTPRINSQRNDQFSRQEMLKQKILSYNRKEKSLEELSKKFIQNFEGKDGFILELDKVTVQLNVQRRRIYDIVNIFESLQVVKKAAKNNYVWRGLKEAIKAINSIEKSDCDYFSISFKKEKSLQNLAARFLKLFIFSTKAITLEQAAKILIHTEDSALIKTKIRRLYDIVNVFKSIGLVHKVYLPSKKPGFQWLGTKRLLEVIQQKKEKCSQAIRQRIDKNDQRENNQALINRQGIDDGSSQQNQKCLFELSFINKFDQKVFQPSILKKSSTSLTMAGSLENLIDMYAQY